MIGATAVALALAVVGIVSFVLLNGPAPAPGWVAIHPEHPTPQTSPLPSVLSAPDADPAVVVTPLQAAAIVDTLWNARAAAFTTHDAAYMAEFETGPALESDEVTCGCTYRAVRGPMLAESVLVPRQTAYPAVFLAEVRTLLDNSPYLQYLIVERESATTPWMIVSDPGDPTRLVLDEPTTDADGFDTSTPPAAGRALRFPRELAAYWQTWTDTGHAPTDSPFAPGPYTTAAGKRLAKAPQGALVRSNGLNGWYRNRAGTAAWSFGTDTGSITCGVVRSQTAWTSATGVYQDPGASNWGPSVESGAYRLMATTDIAQPCFIQRTGATTIVTSGQLDPDTEQGVSPLTSTLPVAP
jgi:hypothetical protein